MTNFNKKFWAIAVSIVLVLSLLPMAISANATEETFNVSTAAELNSACSTINANTSGTYVINIQDDITLTGSIAFNCAVDVTIVGNGNTITYISGSRIHAAGGSNVTLGDGVSELTIVGATKNDEPGAVFVDKNCTVTMKDKVTIKDYQNSNYFGGGVTINGGTFNMDGGTIDNCGIQGGSVCFGGGVAVNKGGVFNMNGGTISNCYATTSLPSSNKGLIPWGAGGGVFVGGGSTFNNNGGTITECSASESGGGVFVVATKKSWTDHGSAGYLDSKFTMTDGEITNNSAPYYGGGVAISGYYVNAGAIGPDNTAIGNPADPGVTISGGKITGNTANIGAGLFGIMLKTNTSVSGVLCNNVAASEGSDVFFQDGKLVLADAATMNENYLGAPSDVTGKKVSAWFEDNEGDRFVDATDKADRVVVDDYATLPTSGAFALIAAPNETTHTVEFKSDIYNSAITPADQDVLDGEKATAPTATEWVEGYILNIGTASAPRNFAFGGWYTDAAFTTKYDFNAEVTDDIVLYAKWSYADYVTEVTLTKTYDENTNYGTDTGLTTDGVLAETITYTITPYSSFNREVGKTAIPDITVVDITTGDGTDTATVAMPDFNPATYGVGDYWYKVVETAGSTAGVKYDENEYYLHVTVTDEDNGNLGVIQALLHKTAPQADGTYVNDANDKTLGFTNEYGAGELSVTKKLSGNMTDSEKEFEITVTFTAPTGKTVTGPITYTGAETGTIAGNWNTTKTVVLTLKGDETVTFTNIPDGVTYKVVESDYTADGYTASYVVDSDTAVETDDVAAAASVSGKITDESDKVTITNTKNSTIDVGVITENAPYVLIIMCIVAFGILMFIKKRKDYLAD